MKYLYLIFAFFLVCSNNISAQENAIITDSIYSNILTEQREYWVKLPENYNPDSPHKYPVVYLLDGMALQNALTTVYDNYWGHYLPNMILVGISNRANRTRDLTTSKIESRNGGTFKQESGGAENFTKFLGTELIPDISEKYPVSNYRTLIGHSYGGLFVVNTLIHHNHLFNNYIAIDPSLDWDDQKLMTQAKSILNENDFSGKSLFISLAAEQLHMFDASITIDNLMDDSSEFTLSARSIVEFAQFAQSESKDKINVVLKVYPEDLHGTVPLPSIRDGLVSLFEWFQFKNPPKYNNPETTIEELKELLENQAEIYTLNFGEPTPPMIEELFNGYGYMNLQMGQPEKAEFFFKQQIAYYPNSTGGYEGLAGFYESEGNNSEALKYMTKAFELSKSDYHKEQISKLKQKK